MVDEEWFSVGECSLIECHLFWGLVFTVDLASMGFYCLSSLLRCKGDMVVVEEYC